MQHLNMNKGLLDESRLAGVSLRYLYDLPLRKFFLHPKHLYAEAIDEMLQKEEIFYRNGFYTVK